MDYEVYFSDTGGTRVLATYTKSCFTDVTLELDPTVSRSIDVRGVSSSSNTISSSDFTTGDTINNGKHEITLTLTPNTSSKMRLDYMKLTCTFRNGTSCSKGIEVTQNPKQPQPASYSKRLTLYDATYGGNKLKSVNCDDAYWIQPSDGYTTDVTAPKRAVVGDCAYDFRQDVFSGYTNLEMIECSYTGGNFIIGKRAFKDCAKLFYILQIDGKFTSVSEEAFMNCSALKSINVSKCTYIGDRAFYNTGIFGVYFNHSTNAKTITIGDEAFANSAIQYFSAGCNLKKLGHRVFYGCAQLKEIWYVCITDDIAIPETYSDTFYGLPQNTKIYVRPKEVLRFKLAWPQVADRIYPGDNPIR